ncbi:MAG TPA: hypothetical protein VG273_28940 [Bryobacteraceae bacterium]|jgi:hypothetical protein|nr:hypothetical protein [Bryobacteraceae bacterium]
MSKSLRFTTGLMLLALLGALVGMIVDPNVITGVNGWLKPAKFAISTAIFSGTIAWIYGYLTPATRLKRLAETLSAVQILEVAIIYVQAGRGTTSHFNQTTPLDGILFGVMGIGIAILWFATIGVFLAALRQKFDDPAWGWAIRLGLLITAIGSAVGGLMIGHNAHTVGGLDGGPGIPGLGWSTEHGDLRIAHFFGLHGLQAIPLFAWLVGKRRRATALIFTAAASYLGLISILTWQALRGESIVDPGSETLAALAVWLLLTAGVLTVFQMEGSHGSRAAVQSL